MKTLSKKVNLFIDGKGKLNFFPFPMEVVTSGKYGNYEVVEQMAIDGDREAISAIEKLKEMTSRARSESGIYYKMQQKKSFNETKAKLYNVGVFKAVVVEFTAEISRNSKSRVDTFNENSDAFGKSYVKIPYTNEWMIINKKISINA